MMRERMEVGGYRLVKRLGFGGMSTVYEAEDEGGTRVALKLLHPSLADAGGRERLAREVQMLQKVTGPYVAEVLDAETEGPDAFIVTELIDGPTLEQDVVDQGVYDGEDLATLGRELAQAVRSIHAAGVLHRDLKPSNVMIDDNGPVLIDFGIAQLGDDSRLTAPGSVTQTPGYCDPKILSGAAPDTEADWWALAAVLAFAATGRPPFGRGGAPAILRRVLDGEADLAGLDEPIARAFAAALAPKRRIGVDDLLDVLEDPGRADAILPDWTHAALAAARTDAGSLHEVGPASGAVAQPTAATEPLADPDRQPTEVLGAYPAEVSGADRQETAVLSPIFDETPPTATMPYAQPPTAPDIAPPAGSFGDFADRTRTYPVAGEAASSWAEGTQSHDAASGLAPMAAPGQAGPQAAGSEPAVAMVGYDAAGNPVYAGGVSSPVPAWARIAPPARWLVFLAGLVVALAGAMWPVPAVAVFAVLHVLFGVHGRIVSELRLRRLSKGGRYSHDVAGAVARSPWALIRAFFSTVVSLAVGIAAGGATAWVVELAWKNEAMWGVSQSFGTALAIFAAMSVAWLMPVNRGGREGARAVAHMLAPSAGYTVFWSIVLVAAGAVLALILQSGGGVPVGSVRNVNIGELWQWMRNVLMPA